MPNSPSKESRYPKKNRLSFENVRGLNQKAQDDQRTRSPEEAHNRKHDTLLKPSIGGAVTRYQRNPGRLTLKRVARSIREEARTPDSYFVSDLGTLLTASMKSNDETLFNTILRQRKKGVKEVGDAIHSKTRNSKSPKEFALENGKTSFLERLNQTQDRHGKYHQFP